MNYKICYPKNSKNDASAADTNADLGVVEEGKLFRLPCNHIVRIYKEGRLSCYCDRQYIAVATP